MQRKTLAMSICDSGLVEKVEIKKLMSRIKARSQNKARPARAYPKGGATLSTSDYVTKFCEINGLKHGI